MLKDMLEHINLFGYNISGVLIFLIKTAVIYLFTQATVSLVRFLFRRTVKRRGHASIQEHNMDFFQRIIVYALYIVGGTAFLRLIPGMEQISTSILASAGIMAMAVGLAAQEALKNFVGGIFIIFSKPYRIGDLIEVAAVKGTVEEITLRHTVLRTADNQKIVVPNSTMNSSNIINSTIGTQAKCAFVEVGISYESNIDKAIELMREEISKSNLLIDHRTKKETADGVPQVVVRVLELGNSAIMLRAWAWAANAADAFVLKCDALKAIKERFDREGIEIPYPHITVKQQ